MPSPRVHNLLADLLRVVPLDSDDPFHAFAADEIRRHVVERTACGADLVEFCRHLMALPRPRPDHAARLAAACASREALAFDFLWTLFTATSGPASAAAAEALASIVDTPKTDPAKAVIGDLMMRSESSTERSLLRLLLRGSGGTERR